MTPRERDVECMRLAIEASTAAMRAGDMPFGAVLVREGAILHVARNVQRTSGDVTGHAEVALLREAAARHGREALAGATVYASGEPCAMCAGAIFWAGVSRVVFAASTADIAAALGPPQLLLRTADLLATGTRAVRVDGTVLRDEAVAVLRAFAEKSRAP